MSLIFAYFAHYFNRKSKMRTYKYIILFVTTLLFLIQFSSCSCNDKRKQDEEVETWDVPEVADTIVDLPHIEVNDTIRLNGTLFHYKYDFHPVDTLPTIKSFSELEYHDNGVDLTLRTDSSEIFHKKFTKNTFKELVPSKDLKKMSLTNFNYFSAKRDDESKFHFLVKISDPEESDEYGYFIDVQISKSGDLHMEKALEQDITTMPLNYEEEPGE